MRIDNTNEWNESDKSKNSEISIKMGDEKHSSAVSTDSNAPDSNSIQTSTNPISQCPNKEDPSPITSFKQIEDFGILYLKKQQKYLIFSALFPVFSILIQIFNIFFILGQFMVVDAPMGHMSHGRPSLFDLLSPSFVFLLLSFIALLKFFILKKWDHLINLYLRNSSLPSKYTSEKDQAPSEHIQNSRNVSLAGLFYEIVDTMLRLRRVFIIFNIIFLFSLQWVFRFIIMVVQVSSDPYSRNILFFNIVNPIGELGLIIYLIVEWRQFLQWNRKLVKLENFEKQVYSELGEGEL